MGVFAYMKVYCPICRLEMDGMKSYGRESHCCSMECNQEWEWRKTLAILHREYYPNPHRIDHETASGPLFEGRSL
jgi:hypothetical protein